MKVPTWLFVLSFTTCLLCPSQGQTQRWASACCMICPLKFIKGFSLMELPKAVEEMAIARFHHLYAGHHRAAHGTVAPYAGPVDFLEKVESDAGAGKMPPCCKVCSE